MFRIELGDHLLFDGENLGVRHPGDRDPDPW